MLEWFRDALRETPSASFEFRASSSRNILFHGFPVIEKLPAIFADCISYCFYPVLETLIRNSRPVKTLILLSYENFGRSIYRAFREVMHTLHLSTLAVFTWALSLFYDQTSGMVPRLFYGKWFSFIWLSQIFPVDFSGSLKINSTLNLVLSIFSLSYWKHSSYFRNMKFKGFDFLRLLFPRMWARNNIVLNVSYEIRKMGKECPL